MKIKGQTVRLAVDHKPGTKEVRGLLCSKCNRGLGFFRHNVTNLRKATEYLESYA